VIGVLWRTEFQILKIEEVTLRLSQKGGVVIGCPNNRVTEPKLTVSAYCKPGTRDKLPNGVLLFLTKEVSGAVLRIRKCITHALN
jgi:hypothetical protein